MVDVIPLVSRRRESEQARGVIVVVVVRKEDHYVQQNIYVLFGDPFTL